MDLLSTFSIFNSENAVKSLLHGGEKFGIVFGDDRGNPIISNVIDLGLIERESLSYNVDIPVGYESYIDSSIRRVIVCSCTLICNDGLNSSPVKQHPKPMRESFSLVKCDYYPSNKLSDPSQPVFDIQLDYSNDKQKILTIGPGSIERMNIVITIDDRFQGSLARWVVLTFQNHQFPSPTCVVETTFVMGIQIRGAVISASARRLLSSEAPAFVPTYLTTYFDSMVSLVADICVVALC
jgi:hypothetical protein